METPSRASFAGFTTRSAQSPSLADIARRIMPSSDKVKVSKEVKQALVNATAFLLVIFILISIYKLNAVIVPHLRTLILALLFGSFLHPMKRSISQFFKQTLRDIRDNKLPILAELHVLLIIIDRAIQRLQSSVNRYLLKIWTFGQNILKGELAAALAVGLAASSLTIIGYGSLINLVICINLIVFVTDITEDDRAFSDAYLHFLIRSFGLAQLSWLQPQLLALLATFVMLWIGLRWLVSYAKKNIVQQVSFNVDTSHPTLRGTYNSISALHRVIIELMEEYIDTFSSVCVIGIVAVIVLLTGVYLSFQVYVESIYLIDKASSSANAIQDSNPEFKSWLPDWLHLLVESAVKNIYQHGREMIRKTTRHMFEELNSTEMLTIERQMIEFWDGAWQKNRSTTGTFQTNHRSYDWDMMQSTVQSLNLTEMLKDNWDTLMSVLSSLSQVIRGNLNLAINLMTITISLLILWAYVLVDFIFHVTLFTTALFYLLCVSGDVYKPIEMLKNLVPRSSSTNQAQRDEFLNLVDESVNAVFTASLKIMVFHGLSTWLLHVLFDIKVVYVPSVVSALLAVVPVMGPYWASLPACLDLWLSNQVSQAFLMFVLATIPTSFVTTAFYSEIKSAGHPYLTGLAIAIGIFLFGFQGALFGPMILVIIRLSPSIIYYLMDLDLIYNTGR